jgi:hypothetical protein
MKENTFNLYEEKRSNETGQSSIQPTDNDLLITVDFSKETFGEMVEKVRTLTEQISDTTELNIFILSGYEPHKDAGLFLDYLKSLNRTIRFFFRGIIHLEFLKLLSFLNVHVNEGSKLKYDTSRTHEFQKQLMIFPAVFRNYFQRFIDEYNKFNGEIYLDVTEMKTLGFDFKIY